MNTLSRLVDALRCLPGVGPKSAQRMAFYLLQHRREQGLQLASCLAEAMNIIRHCDTCNNLTDTERCHLCMNPNRDASLLCIVESPTDVMAIEQTQAFHGYYFVLMNRISPLDGIGPDDIGLPKLQSLIHQSQIQEVILALSPSIEGQTTAHFIQELLQPYNLRLSQLAHGIPSGGELEFLDSGTIGSALRNRASVKTLNSA